MLIAAIATWCPTAAAHSFPEAESPSAGQEMSTPPRDVTIRYDAPIEKLFAKLEVLNAEGKSEVAGEPEVGPDGLTLSVKVGALQPGEYTVKWSVLCIDTHHTEGSYQFTVTGSGS
jgi:methionine-rich copper-binding protein CopC